MNSALQARAEILKLARLLGCDPADLGYLETVDRAELVSLREQVTEMLFTAHGQTLNRLAAGSKLLPIGVVTMLGQRVFGPVLSARITGLLDPDRAVEMAAKLPTSFLADVAIELDPRRASEVIGRIPALQIADVARELMRRGEYVTMGRFVGHLRDEAVVASLGVMDDPALLRTAFVMEEKDKLDQVVALLPEQRHKSVIDAAARDGLWPEALDLLAHLSRERRADFANRAAAHDDAVLDSLITAAHAEQMWAEVLPLTSAMSEESRRRFVSLPALQAPGVLEEIARTAVERGLREELAPLIELLPPDGQQRVSAYA